MNIAITRTWALEQRARNFAASFFFVTCAFLIYRYSPHAAGLRMIWHPGNLIWVRRS